MEMARAVALSTAALFFLARSRSFFIFPPFDLHWSGIDGSSRSGEGVDFLERRFFFVL